MDIFGIIFGLMINAGLLIVLIFAIPDTVLRYIEYFRRIYSVKNEVKKGDVIKFEYSGNDWQTCA